MGIYNYTVLKSKPIKAVMPIGNGLEALTNIYRIKFQGKDFMLGWFSDERVPFQASGDMFFIDVLRRRAEQAWGGDRPQFLVELEHEEEEGFPVFECNYICYQEAAAWNHLIGHVRKIGRGKYQFFPKVSEKPADNIHIGN